MRFLPIPLLQRYILRDLLVVFSMMLSGMTVLLVFVGVFREITANGLGPEQALQILPYVVPSLLPFTIPATLLLTVCIVYGRMSADREIIAAKAAGINVLSLLMPAFSLGAILSLCSLLLADKAIPWAVHNIRAKVTQAMEDIFLDMLRTRGQVVEKNHGFAITVKRVDGKRLIQPTFHYKPRGKKAVTVQATEAMLKFDMDRREIILHLKEGRIVTAGQNRIYLKQQTQRFPMPFQPEDVKPRHMSIREIRAKLNEEDADLDRARGFRDAMTVMSLTLGEFDQLAEMPMFEYRERLKDRNKRHARMRTEIHSRFALSTTCFLFVLIGAPFAIMKAQRQFLTTFFMCFLPILLLYYPVALLMMNLSKSQSAPAVCIWLANLLLLAVAGLTLRKVLRH